jgi:hypothetical protein
MGNVISDFHDAQREFDFRMKFGSSKTLCHLIKADRDENGWHVLMQLRDNRRVVKVSVERFRKSIPPHLDHLAAKFDEWFQDPNTDKSEFVHVDYIKYVSDGKAERLTGEKPLSIEDLVASKKEKQKQDHEDFEARKKARKELPAWSDVPRGRRGPGVFAGMCA